MFERVMETDSLLSDLVEYMCTTGRLIYRTVSWLLLPIDWVTEYRNSRKYIELDDRSSDWTNPQRYVIKPLE